MPNTQEIQAIEKAIILNNYRFDPLAYPFLLDALNYTVTKQQALATDPHKSLHVTGQELVQGFCELALQEMGPLALHTIHYWGITKSIHIGEIIYALIQSGLLSKQKNDKLEDFTDVLNLEDALQTPFTV